MLTSIQKKWLVTKEIKVNNAYMFPRFGFMIYSSPSYLCGVYIDTNPFTKSLDKELFLVKEKVNGFCRGNFYHKPKGQDIYISEVDLCRRDLFIISLLVRKNN